MEAYRKRAARPRDPSLSPTAKHQEVLIGQETVLCDENKASLPCLRQEVLARNLVFEGRTHRELPPVVVDVRQMPSLAKGAAQTAKVRDSIWEMVKRVRHQNQIAAGGRKQRIPGQAQDRRHIGDACLLNPISENIEKPGFHVDREDRSTGAHLLSQTQREVARPGTDVARYLSRAKLERSKDLFRHLPGIPVGRLHFCDVALEILRVAMFPMMSVPGIRSCL